MNPILKVLPLVAALIVALTGGLAAEPAVARSGVAPAQPSADERTVAAAMAALNHDGYAALAKHLTAVKAVLDHAPQNLAAGSPEAQVYGSAAMLLAAFSNELKRYEEAARYGDIGLRYTPADDHLVTETALAYGSLNREDEALRLLDGWLSAASASDPRTKARVLRAKGFNLIELNRLDEAEAAYRASLDLEPDHQGAKNELTYIAGLRRGKAPTGSVTTTYGKAKTGDYDGARQN